MQTKETISEDRLSLLKTDAVISIVDDDESVRKSLKRLLKSIGFETRVFPSAMEFLNQGPLRAHGCAIIDVRMPEMNGLDLQKRMLSSGIKLPVIFITAHEDAAIRMQAMAAGAINFLQKPFSDLCLREAICEALEKSNQASASPSTVADPV